VDWYEDAGSMSLGHMNPEDIHPAASGKQHEWKFNVKKKGLTILRQQHTCWLIYFC